MEKKVFEKVKDKQEEEFKVIYNEKKFVKRNIFFILKNCFFRYIIVWFVVVRVNDVRLRFQKRKFERKKFINRYSRK